MSTYKILLVEDDPIDYRIISAKLNSSRGLRCEIQHAETLGEAMALLKTYLPHIILLDLSLPDSLGIETLLKTRSAAGQVPIIVLTGYDDEATALKAVREGAQDYIIKGQINHQLLTRSVLYAMERNTIMQKAEQAEHGYRLLLDTMNEGAVYIDNENLIRMVNQRFTELTGYTDEELYGTKFDLLIASSSDGARQNVFIPQLNDANPFEIKLRKKNGSYGWFIIKGKTLLEANGIIAGALMMHTEITEQKKAQQHAKEKEKEYHTLLETMHEGLVYVDNASHLKYANKRFCEMTGFAMEELLDKPVFEELLSGQSTKTISAIKNSLRNPSGSNAEIELKKKSGEKLYCRINATPIYNESNEPIGSLGTLSDITEEKITKEKLHFTSKELNRFIYKTSHDLKGPIASIIGLTNVAKYDVNEPASLRYFDMIHTSAATLDDMLTNLLHVVRIKDEQVIPASISIRLLVGQLIAKFKMTDESGEIKFSSDLNCKEHFCSDIRLLTPILNNLIDNGVKFRRRDYIDPAIHIKIYDYQNGIRIEIEDNGIGIRNDYMKQLFYMFSRGNADVKGAGLGLYLVKNAVEKLRGTIETESQEGIKTKFSIYIPEMIPDLNSSS